MNLDAVTFLKFFALAHCAANFLDITTLHIRKKSLFGCYLVGPNEIFIKSLQFLQKNPFHEEKNALLI